MIALRDIVQSTRVFGFFVANRYPNIAQLPPFTCRFWTYDPTYLTYFPTRLSRQLDLRMFFSLKCFVASDFSLFDFAIRKPAAITFLPFSPVC